jgi:hypothetical protein
MSLDDLIEKISGLAFQEVFHQPYDLSGTFQEEAIEFIKKYFYMYVASEGKELYEEYVVKSIQVLLVFKLLDGNVNNLFDIIGQFDELSAKDSAAFDIVFKKALEGEIVKRRLNELVDYYNDTGLYPLMRNYSIYDYFNISKNILFAPSRVSFGNCTSITTDSRYLYIILTGIHGGMLKVGTGNLDTVKGKVYLFEKIPCLEDASYQWVYARGKLYLKTVSSANRELGYLTIINPDTFKNEGRTKLLLPESVKHPVLKRKNENYVLLSDSNNLYVILLEPVFKDNAVHKSKRPDSDDEQVAVDSVPKTLKDFKKVDPGKDSQYPADIFTYLNLTCYTFPLDDCVEDGDNDNEHISMINELYESFSHLFSKQECKKALILNKWDVEKTAMYLVDNEKDIKQPILIYTGSTLLFQSKIEQTLYKNNRADFKTIKNNVFDVVLYDLLKWSIGGEYIMAYKIREGACILFHKDGGKTKDFLYKYQIGQKDLLPSNLVSHSGFASQVPNDIDELYKYTDYIEKNKMTFDTKDNNQAYETNTFYRSPFTARGNPFDSTYYPPKDDKRDQRDHKSPYYMNPPIRATAPKEVKAVKRKKDKEDESDETIDLIENDKKKKIHLKKEAKSKKEKYLNKDPVKIEPEKPKIEEKIVEDKVKGTYIKVVNCLHIIKHDSSFCYDPCNKQYYILINGSLISLSVLVSYTFEKNSEALLNLMNININNTLTSIRVADQGYTGFKESVTNLILLFHAKKPDLYWKYNNWNYYFNSLVEYLSINRDFGLDSYSNEYPYPLLPPCAVSQNAATKKAINQRIEKSCEYNEKILKQQIDNELLDNYNIVSTNTTKNQSKFFSTSYVKNENFGWSNWDCSAFKFEKKNNNSDIIGQGGQFVYLSTRRVFYMCVDGEEKGLERILNTLEKESDIKYIWLLYFWCEAVDTSMLLKREASDLLNRLRKVLRKLYEGQFKQMAIRILLTGWEFICCDLKHQIYWLNRLYTDNLGSSTNQLSLNLELNILGVENHNPYSVLLQKLSWAKSIYLSNNFHRINLLKLFLFQEDDKNYQAKSHLYPLNPKNVCFPLHWLLIGKMLKGNEVTKAPDVIKSAGVTEELNFEEMIGDSDFRTHFRAFMEKNNISMDKTSISNFLVEGATVTLEKLHFKKYLVNFTTEIGVADSESREKFIETESGNFWQFIRDGSQLQLFLDSFLLCLGDVYEYADEALLFEFLNKTLDLLESVLSQSDGAIALAITVLNSIYSRFKSSTCYDKVETLRERIYGLNKTIVEYFNTSVNEFNLINAVKALGSGGNQLEKERVFEYIMNPSEVTQINESVRFPNTNIIVVEIDLKLAKDKPVNYDLIIVSDEHSYSNLRYNTNNNYNNYGTCFLMKMNVGFTKRLYLSGEEIKIISPSELELNKGAYKAKLYPKKDGLGTTSMAKSYLKIKCYPYQLMPFAYPKEYETVINKSSCDINKRWLYVLKDLNYFNSYINKTMLKSSDITSNESILNEQILRVGLYRYDDCHIQNLMTTFESVIGQFTSENYNPKIRADVEALFNAIYEIDKVELYTDEIKDSLALFSSTLIALKNLVREVISEPVPYRNLKMYSSFNNKMKAIWTIVESAFLLCLIYHLNIEKEVVSSSQLELLGSKMNILLSWMASRAQLLKSTFDSLKNYLEMIIEMNNKFVDSIKALIVERLKLNEREAEQKTAAEDGSKAKAIKSKVTKLAEKVKPINFKKKANVKRLYQEIPKKKKKEQTVAGVTDVMEVVKEESVDYETKNLEYFINNHSVVVNELLKSENILSLKTDMKQKIETDIKDTYFANPENLKNILETNNLQFNEANLNDSLKTYNNFIIKSLGAYYNFEDLTIDSIEGEKLISKLYTKSPYSNIAFHVLNKILFLMELNSASSSNDIRDSIKKKTEGSDSCLTGYQQSVVKSMFNFLYKNSNLPRVKHYMIKQYQRLIVRQKGIKGLVGFSNKSLDELFLHNLGSICSATKKDLLNGIETVSESLMSSYISKEDIGYILNTILTCYNSLINPVNLKELKFVNPSDNITNEYIHAYKLKNLNLALTDINILLNRAAGIYIPLDLVKTFVSSSNRLIFNEYSDIYKDKLQKMFAEFVDYYKLILSKFVNLNGISNIVIECLFDTLDQMIIGQDSTQVTNVLSMIHDISSHLIDTNGDGLTKGINKLFELIIMSEVHETINLSCKICKTLLKNNTLLSINGNIFDAIYEKLGKLYTFKDTTLKNLSPTDKKYVVMVQMNSPEIDYQFLINALYYWEERYPTKLSIYKYKEFTEYTNNPSKEKEILETLNLGRSLITVINYSDQKTKLFNYFNPLKSKVTKMSLLEKIAEERVGNLRKAIEEGNKFISSKTSGEKPSEGNINIELIKERIMKLKQQEAYQLRIQSHIKTAELIGETACTRGFVCLEPSLSKRMAEELAEIIHKSYNRILPHFKANIEETICLFNDELVYPKMPEKEQLLPGCTNTLKETTVPFMNVTLLEEGINERFTSNIKAFTEHTKKGSNKYTYDDKASSKYGTYSYSYPGAVSTVQAITHSALPNYNEISGKIIDNSSISGSSITMIIEEIINLIYYSYEDEKVNDLVSMIQSEVCKINKTEWDKISKGEKLKLLGLLIISSGFYQNLHNNSRAIFNKNNDNVCKILSGGQKTGKNSSHVIFLKDKQIKVEKVNNRDLDKVKFNRGIVNMLSLKDLIEALINSFEIFIDNKDNLINKMLLHLVLKIFNEKSVSEEEIIKIIENERDGYAVRIARFTEILKLISNETLWLEKEDTYWEIEFIEAFERIYNRIDTNAELIYTPIFHFIGENANFIPIDPTKIDTNDLITKYQLPVSNYVRYLPKITDLSKFQTALKNIQNFDRYVVGEIFNYCKSQFRDDEYLNSLYQIRYHLSNNDIPSAKADINTIFDNNKVPPAMPLPKETYDMKEIAKEECYPGNYYMAKLSPKFVRDSGIKSLIKQSSIGINDFPILLLAHDNVFNQALVMYSDVEYGMVYTFWIPIDCLMFLEQQLKLPANSYPIDWLLGEFYYLEKRLRILYSKNLLTNFSYILTKNKKVNKFDELMYFLDLTNWQNYKLNPATGVFHDFTNYISIKNLDIIQNASNVMTLGGIQDLVASSSKISDGNVAISRSGGGSKKYEIEKILNGLTFDNRSVNELVMKWCMDNWDNIDKSFKKIKTNLYNEYNVNYNENLRSKRVFNIGNFSRKMLGLHELVEVDISNYASIVLSFDKDAYLGPHSKISFYSDPYGENLVHEIQAIKTTKTNLDSIVFNYPKIWMHYTPATRAFYIFEWFVTSRDSNLQCSLTYLPHKWSTLISLTDYTTSTLFTDINRTSLDSFEKIIRKLLSHCISLSLPAELHRRVFNITNRVILKASKYLSLLEQQKKIKFSEFTISQKFGIIGIDEYTLMQLISNINNFNNSGDKSFSSGYVVEGVEILLSILGIIKESFNTLDHYLKDTFEYNLPVWIEAIIKLGQFLSFFQGTSNLEGILMKEVYDQLNICNQFDNLIVIQNIPASVEDSTITSEILGLLSKTKARVVDLYKDIQVVPGSESKAVCVLLDGFIIENVKEEEQEVPEPEDPLWTCFYCGNDNDKENISCIFCDKNKKIKPKEKPKKKSSLIKTLSINDKMKELIGLIKSAQKLTEYSVSEQVDGETKTIKKFNAITVSQGDELKRTIFDNPVVKDFLYKRLIAYCTEKEYMTEKLTILENSVVSKYISNEITVIKNLLNSEEARPDIDLIKVYEVLQNNGVDLWLESVVLDPQARNMEININLMEKIRELVDLKVCEEKMTSLIFPAPNLRFIPSTFSHLNHTTLDVIENYYRELREIPLAVIRYYWVLIKYFNNCLSAALPFIKPPDTYISTSVSNASDGYINIPFPKTISAFLSSSRGIAFSIIKQNLIKEITASTDFNEEEVQIPTFKFERLNIINQVDKSSRKKVNGGIMGDIDKDENKEELRNDESIFLQAYEQAKEVDLAFFRSKKLPGDPHVSFKVEFKGELVQGIGGPYRQFFSDISAELQCRDFKNKKTLRLLYPTSNNQTSRGEYKDKYTITPSYNTNTALNQYEFLGILMGICIRTGVHLTLDLCSLIWKKMVRLCLTNLDRSAINNKRFTGVR